MVITFERIVHKYSFDSEVTGAGELNPILYRFVLPDLYFKASSTEVESQMPGENLTDPSVQRNLAVLAALSFKGKFSGKAQKSDPVVKA